MTNFRKIAQASMLGFAVLSMTAPAADARVRGPQFVSNGATCQRIQDELDRVVNAFKHAKSRAEANALRHEGHNLVNDWNAAGCQAAFGNWWRVASQNRWQWHAPNAGVVVAPAPRKPSHRVFGRVSRFSTAD